jgi:outer membrane protein assembly factor BamD (BamD/ComL family)
MILLTTNKQALSRSFSMDCLKRLSLVFAIAVAMSFSGTAVLAQATKTQAVSLYNLGLTAYKQGSPESAIIFFKRAADIDPDLADAQYNLGVLYQSEKRLKEAIPRFQEVLRVKPTDADAHYQLGLAFSDLGRPQDAREHLLAIAPNSPHFAEAQKRLSTLGDQQYTPPNGGQAYVPPPSQQPPVQQPQTPPSYQQPSVTQQPQTPPSYQPPPPVQPPPVTPSNPVATIPNTTVAIIATGFKAPSGVAVDKQKNIYIANFLSNTIDRITADGARSQFSMGVNLKGPIGMVIDDAGNVYVANYIGGYITRINPAGISSVIATGFKKPYYLTQDGDGSLLVSQQEDNSVVRITLPPRATSARAQLPQVTK